MTQTGMTTELAAALVGHHTEAHGLLTRVADRIDSINPDTADWGHIGNLAHIVSQLRNALGEDS